MTAISDVRLTPRNYAGGSLRVLDASGNGMTATTASACNNLAQLSFSMWFKPCFSTTATPRLFYKGSATVTQAWLDVFLAYSTGRLTIQTGFSTQGIWNVQKQVALNRWNHLVVTYDGSSLSNIPTVYLNDDIPSVTVGTAPVGSRAADTTNLMIGRGAFAATRYVPGLYRNFRLYNRILTAAEADALYRRGQVPTGVVLEYLLNEATGTTLNDTSGSANGNATVTGGSWVASDVPSRLRIANGTSRVTASSRIPV